MIPDIKELNFPKKDGKQYATLTQATANIADMGEKTITSQVKIDGEIVPDFSFDWEVEFQGEKYIMPLRIPQGAKENTSLNSTIDLTFQHWAIYQLKRWTFITIQQIAAGTYLPDEEVATVSLNLGDFCTLFGQVLDYYYNGAITIDLNPAWQYDNAATVITISHTKIWNVLIDAFYDKYGVRWEIKAASDNSNTVKGGEKYVIRVGYPTTEVDHIFEYGFEGGLLKVERQVQSEEIRNMLKGRGGDTNIPFRYFKNTDPNNPDFRPDPDWVEELANVPFTNLMPATFRSYVQGWKAAHISKYAGYTAVGEANAYAPWAYRKGYTDTKFAPVEFVADEITISPTTGDKQVEILPGYSPYVKQGSSIDKYGPLPDTLDNNDDIYPTLQGTGLDIAVDVEQIESDDVAESTESDAKAEDATFPNIIKSNVPQGHATAADAGKRTYFSVPTGKKANIEGYAGSKAYNPKNHEDKSSLIAELDYTIKVFNVNTGEERSASGIPQGYWYFTVEYSFNNTSPDALNVTLSFNSVKITSATPSEKWRNTFDIWVKNIWGSSKKTTESDEEYSERVWKPVLGDSEGNTAKVVFTSGALAISEDYEFTIIGFPAYDTSKTYGGAQSHWRMTLAKSEAELEATGLYVPSTKKQGKAGDTFVFIGIEMTHEPYVTDAEKRLDDWKKDQLGEVKEIKPTFVVTTDRVRLGNEGKADALISQLHAGSSIRLADKRFISGTYETLYLQSITYTYREPTSDDAALNPDVEIVLGNEYTTSANPVSMMQSEISALQKQVGSISNVEQIVRAVGDKLYLRKDGISDRSLSPTQFFSLLTSGDFRAGMVGGAGWGFFKDENGSWVLEADKINARLELQANTLVINQVEGRGGMIVESAAAMEVTQVEDTDAGYICRFDQKGGSVANLFHLNDVAYCQRFTPENGELKYYRRKVTAVSTDSITLSKTDVDGSGIPEEGDNIVHFGNYVDKTRQYVKVRDVVNGGYERYIEGLDSVSADGTEYYFVGRQYGLYGGKPRWFIGDPNGEYAEWINGKLNIKGSLSIGSTIGGDTFEEYIKKVSPPVKQEDIEQFVNNIVNPKLEGIQDQIDGVIETWFYNGVPTLSNYPASGWNTDALKIQHLGDLYYDNDTGTAYRFSKNEQGAYYWNVITDDAITKALAAAQKAQDTADGKRRVFTSQPTVQQIYDIGDLWVNATYGTQYSNDLLRCVTHKDAGAAFNIEHWTLASKYTDDTLANQVKTQVDNLSTTVNNVSNTVNGLKNFTDTAFSDGIIDRSEASAIQTYLKNIETAQKEVTKAYDSVDSNTLLPSANKTALASAKAAFDSAANALVVKITEVIADNVATSEERAAVNSLYTAFNTKYGDFIYALNQANAAIMGALNININKLGYLTKAMKELTTIQNGLILSSVVSLGVNNADFTTQTTYSGISGIHDDSKIGGGIAAWYGGDMIDKFDYYNASTGEFNIPDGTRVAMGLDRMDGTGYRANGNLWWDANGVVHADPLSFFVGESTVGALLASFQVVLQADGKHPDYLIPQVPFQNLTVASSIKIGNGYLKWDETNKAFYVEQADGSAAHFYATGGVSALGMSSISGGGTGGGLIETVLGYSDITSAVPNDNVTVFNADTVKKIYDRLVQVESGALTSVDWSIIQNKPTTLAGYGITDAYTKIQTDSAITSKINALDVASAGGSGKYIQAISQTDGKISATEATMPTALKNPTAITIQKNGTSLGSYDGSEAKTINISDVASAATLSSHTGNTTMHITAAERTKWNKVVTDFAAITGTDTDTIINKWEEVVAFLDTYTEADTLANLLGNKADKTVKISAGTGLTGGGDLSANRTLSLAASGVTAGTYTKVTVDAYGRVTAGATLAAADIPSLPWSKITSGKPTTLSGYGITDAYTKTDADGRYVNLTGAQTISGQKTFSKPILHPSTATWINGMKEGSVINFPTAGYDSLVHWKTKDGHISISSHAQAGNSLTFGYMTDAVVTAGTNSLSKSIYFDMENAGISGVQSIKIGSCTISWDSANNALKFDKNIYSEGGVSALGMSTVSGGSGGLVESIYRWADLGGTFSDSANDTFNAYTINKIRADLMSADSALSSRVTNLEGGAAVNVTTTGSGNAITAISKSGTTITATKGATFLTAITKAQVEAVLTGNITSHTHSQYLTAHQSLANYVPWSKQSMATVNGTNHNPQFFNIENEKLIANSLTYWSVINFGSFSGGNFRSQIAMPYQDSITDTDMFIRTANYKTWRSWRKVLHSGNTYLSGGVITINGTSITPLTAHQSLANYVTLNTAQTITGQKTFGAGLLFSDLTGTNTRNLLYQKMADNDFFRLLVGGTATNAGYVELATADDGNEPIYVRQYTGVFSTLAHSITLMDGSGNQTFNTVTAAALKKSGGTSSQFLKADGSVDSNTYLTTGTASSTYVKKSGDIMTGTLTVSTNGTGAYNQGIRINRTALASWATLTIGNVGTGTAGSSANTWLIGTPANSNSLIFNLNGASETAGLCLKGHGNTDMKWNNNTLWHAGNDGSGSGLDADLLDGVHASKFPYINNSGSWHVYGNAAAAALADNTAGLSAWAFGEIRNHGITYLGILKPSAATCGISANGTIAVFGQGDTHMGLAIDYYGANLQVFGGNADKILWRKSVAFIDSTVANSDKCDGLHVHGGRNNEANKIVRTDGSGYLQVGYINSSNGNEGNNSSPARVWGTNGSDNYMRTYLTSALAVYSATQLATARTIWGQSFNGTGNVSGNMTGVGSITASGTIKTTAAQGFLCETATGVRSYMRLKSGTPLWDIAVKDTHASGALQFRYNGADVGVGMVLATNGNVGIGTTTPSYKLDVAGTISAANISASGNVSAAVLMFDSNNYMKVKDGYLSLNSYSSEITLSGIKDTEIFVNYRKAANGHAPQKWIWKAGSSSSNADFILGRLYLGGQQTNAIEWDATNSAFKFNGNLYATGGISALGASYLSATSISVSSLTASNLNLGSGDGKKIRFGTNSNDPYIEKSNYDLIIGDDNNNGFIDFINDIALGSGCNWTISIDGSAYLKSLSVTTINLNGATFSRSGSEIYVTISGTRYKLTKAVG